MFNGASRSTFDRLSHRQTHNAVFGTTRSQLISCQTVDGETLVIRGDATIENASINSLAIDSSIQVPRLVVNLPETPPLTGLTNAVIVGITDTESAGESSVLVGSGSGSASNSISIGQGNNVSSNGDYSIVIGTSCTGNADHNIILGTGDANNLAYNIMVGFGTSVATGNSNTVIGQNSQTVGLRNIVMGDGAQVIIGNDCISIGTLCTVATVNNAIAIGLNGDIGNNADGAVAIGANHTASEEQSVVIGNLASAVGPKAVSVGATSSTAAVTGAVAVGYGADANGAASVAVGYASSSGYGVSIGGSASCLNGIAMGPTSTSNYSSVAIGNTTLATHDDCVALGSSVATRLDNEFATAPLRLVRVTVTTTNTTPVQTIFFNLTNAGESVVVDGAVTLRTTANDNASFTFQNYLFERTGTMVSVFPGMRSINNPLQLIMDAELIVTGVSGNNSLRFEVTGILATTTVWTGVFRIWCAPKA